MNNALNTPAADGITRREGLLTLLGGALALAGCGGGGGGSAGLSSGGTGSFSVGPITGFGSIIVNGVHFDDSVASSILDVDDNKDLRGQLKLGMMVRVKGKPKSDSLHADAESIEVRSELLGPIDSIPSPQTTPPTLVVLGQTVQITATTIFKEGLSGLSALAVGDVVEVHGFVDPAPAANRITATRIEREDDPTQVKAFKLQGTVSFLDTTAKTFKIGTLTISFAAPVDIPANLVLANGLLVRVKLATTPLTGTRKALKIRAVEAEVEDRDEAEVEGTITFIDPVNNKLFKVNGQQVDATGVSALPTLKVGDRVEVEGKMVKGVLVANKVELEDENDPEKFEVHGTVGSLNTTAKTFVLSMSGVTVTVDYSAATFRPAGKTAADLANGVKVEVKGTASTDGTKVKASVITFE